MKGKKEERNLILGVWLILWLVMRYKYIDMIEGVTGTVNIISNAIRR